MNSISVVLNVSKLHLVIVSSIRKLVTAAVKIKK